MPCGGCRSTHGLPRLASALPPGWKRSGDAAACELECVSAYHDLNDTTPIVPVELVPPLTMRT
jgi:hypothetical protein